MNWKRGEMKMKKNVGARHSVFLGAVLSLAAAGALAQGNPPKPVSSEPEAQNTAATFGDWQLRCSQVGQGAQAQKTCEVVQSVVLKGQSAPFAQFAIGRPKPGEPTHVTAVVPINVSFPSNIRLAEDDKGAQPLELAYTRCMPAGCFATAALKDETLKKWRGLSQMGQAKFKNAAGQDVQMPLSFRGLAQALDALAKEK